MRRRRTSGSNPPPVVDANAVLTLAVSPQNLETVPGRSPQVAEKFGRLDHEQLGSRPPLDLMWQPSGDESGEHRGGLSIGIAPDHTVQPSVTAVSTYRQVGGKSRVGKVAAPSRPDSDGPGRGNAPNSLTGIEPPGPPETMARIWALRAPRRRPAARIDSTWEPIRSLGRLASRYAPVRLKVGPRPRCRIIVAPRLAPPPPFPQLVAAAEDGPEPGIGHARPGPFASADLPRRRPKPTAQAERNRPDDHSNLDYHDRDHGVRVWGGLVIALPTAIRKDSVKSTGWRPVATFHRDR